MPPALPVWEEDGGRMVVRSPDRAVVAEVGGYEDELFAYLMFDYVRSRNALAQTEVWLTLDRDGEGRTYTILLHLQEDLLAALPLLASLEADGLIPGFEWRLVAKQTLAHPRQQTQLFVAAYNVPVRRKLETLSQAELAAYTRRFLRFKSVTDRRVRTKMEPTPVPLSREEAHRLAADIITVADFFRLPVDFFLGIGAMENNYMNVKGDLAHGVWKRRPAKGDVVLKRRRGRVFVLNESSGVWQITRETLRYAHRLYTKDGRDYSLLPEHLRPSAHLSFEEVRPEVLTTYAGILFRDLLDRFDGDIAKAVGAYNGGPGNPNMRYEAGVRMVAEYGRRILEQAAALNGQPAAEIQFLVPVGGQ
jgi:hypothetical protein